MSAVEFAVFGGHRILRGVRVRLPVPARVGRPLLGWPGRPAGKTEIRCYYGAVSWGLAGFAAYLWSRGLELEALTGVLFLAGAVLTTRVVGTVVDRCR